MRSDIIGYTIKLIPIYGVSEQTLMKACKEAGNANMFCTFQDGIIEVLREVEDSIDRSMFILASGASITNMRIRDRIFFVIKSRLLEYLKLSNYREFLRAKLGFFLLPQNWADGMLDLEKTASNLWAAAEDKSSDFSYYTKRISLSALYYSTLVYFINDFSEDFEKTFDFLQRRIGSILAAHNFKKNIRSYLDHICFNNKK